ncbi:DUF2000 domain-containing protein [Paramixta manurensis]|uniref:DUF2000 domain-containing protein n=1 Tax=Paramixta manurensis TaxID=2740817 RepID=A0A6M8UR10_9GAMM|nr:DUF2000 domain-containing protein [Erwiniaceae bacterium PD-1]
MFQDNDRKLYVIVNRNAEVATQMNAIGHLSAGIMLKAEEPYFHDYLNRDSGFSAWLNHYPVVILQSKNSNQLASALQKCSEAGLLYNFFTTTMLSHSSEQQIADTLAAPFEQLEFIALAIYGDASVAGPITKKFSVYK